MTKITIEILSQPSKSKGWARYQVRRADGTPVVESNTGNPWVSAGHSGEAEDAAAMTLVMDVLLRVGKNRTAREERSQSEVELVAAAGETCEVEYRPGSQGIRLRVSGARRA
jgi:hypothetical protein